MQPEKPLFSIIMPSRLGPYKGAASYRDQKIVRAIQSVLAQDLESWELIIVSDGCQQTIDIVEALPLDTRKDQVKLVKIEQQQLWSGTPRNIGIEQASGKWIVYLDIDDFYGPQHLDIIQQGLATNREAAWVYYNDMLALPLHKTDGKLLFNERTCLIDHKGKNGTANICHQRVANIRWDHLPTYDHDWHFIRQLMRVSREQERQPIRIATPQYYVCHYPGIDV